MNAKLLCFFSLPMHEVSQYSFWTTAHTFLNIYSTL